MPSDLAQLFTTLNNTKLQRDNNALYQVIKGLIGQLQSTNTNISTITNNNSTPIISINDDISPLLLIAQGQKNIPESTSTGDSDLYLGSMLLGGM